MLNTKKAAGTVLFLMLAVIGCASAFLAGYIIHKADVYPLTLFLSGFGLLSGLFTVMKFGFTIFVMSGTKRGRRRS